MTGTGADGACDSAPARSPAGRGLVAATYNIHRCFGTDGRYNPGRVAAVLEELDADVLGLQEVDPRLAAAGGHDQLSFLAHRLGSYVAAGLNIVNHRGQYGNALLSRWPIVENRLIDLSAIGREPRGGIDALIAWPAADRAGPLRAIVTHFGLRGWERRRQISALLRHIAGAPPGQPLLLMGDLNEWLHFGAVSRRLGAALSCGARVGSFPARWPLLPLDRICSRSLTLSSRPTRHVSQTSRLASDHLPVRATFTLPPAASSSPSVVDGVGNT